MSIVDNQKIVGTAFFIIGILMILSALLSIVDAFTMEGELGDHIGYFIAAIGALITAVLYFKFGNSVRKGDLTGKLNILGNYVRVVGVNTIIYGIFAAIGGIISDISFWDNVISIILGIIVVWAAKKILDGKETTIDKILWIVLTVIFLVLFILGLAGLFGLSGDAIHLVISALSAICSIIVYLFMLLYMFDGEVKKGMGM